MRKFCVHAGAVTEVLASGDTPRFSGCDAELTVLALPHGKTWWTFGYEAFGTLDGVEHDLASTVALLNVRSPPRLPPGEAASYPAWFAAHTSFPVQ